MHEPMHRLTQAFVDPEVDEAYHDDSAARARKIYLIVFLVSLPATLAAWFDDPRMFGSPGNVEVIHRSRYVQFVALAAVAAFGFTSARTFRRWWREVAVAGALALLLIPTAASLQLPNPERLDIGAIYVSAITLLIGAAVVMPIGIGHVTAMTILVVVPILVAALTWRGYHGDAAIWLVFATVIALIAGYMVNWRDRVAFAASYRLAEARAREDVLRRVVLPAPIAARVDAGEASIADRFDDVTVLFARVTGITALAQRLPPARAVATLDEVTGAFEELAAREGLDRPRSFGDAWLIVGGAPTLRADHPTAIALLALELRELIATRRFGDGTRLEVQIGVHVGPVVGGVIGKAQLAYELWGETVEVASRTAAAAAPGAVVVSAAAEARLRDEFELEPYDADPGSFALISPSRPPR